MPDRGATALLQRSKWAVGALVGSAFAAALGLMMALRESSVASEALSGDASAPSRLLSAEDARVQVARLQLVLMIVTAVVFIMWFRRAERNIRNWDARGLPFDDWWNVGGWLIPVANLFVPIRMTAVIWRATDASVSPEIGEEWKTKSLSPLVPLWWATWIGGTVVFLIASNQIGAADDPETLRSALGLSAVSNVLVLAAAVLAIMVVRTITARQATRAEFYRVAIPDPPVARAI